MNRPISRHTDFQAGELTENSAKLIDLRETSVAGSAAHHCSFYMSSCYAFYPHTSCYPYDCRRQTDISQIEFALFKGVDNGRYGAKKLPLHMRFDFFP